MVGLGRLELETIQIKDIVDTDKFASFYNFG